MSITPLVFCIVLIAVCAAGWYFSDQVIAVRSFTVEETYQCEVDCGKLIPAEWEALPRQDVCIPSPFGYELYGVFIPVEVAWGTVIIAHGITFSVYGSVKYINCSASAVGMSCCTTTAPMAVPVGNLKPMAFMRKMT
jgi:hypothetical protein